MRNAFLTAQSWDVSQFIQKREELQNYQEGPGLLQCTFECPTSNIQI
jgi:hypothetical protein